MVINYIAVAVASAAVGYVVADRRLKKEYKILLERDTAEIKDRYERQLKRRLVELRTDAEPEFVEAAIDAAESLGKYAGVKVEPEDLATEMLNATEKTFAEVHTENSHEEDKTDLPEPTKVEELVQTGVPQPPRIDYRAISSPPKKAKEDEKPGETESSGIEYITPGAFQEEQFQYRQFAWEFYAKDDILATSMDKIVSPPARMEAIGEKVLDKLRKGREAMGGLDTLYIRNHQYGLELEIKRLPDSYVEVTSVTEEEAMRLKPEDLKQGDLN
jgi:hypothetical protein